MTRLLALLFLTASVLADVPVPPRMQAPATPAEAWNVIHLASANVERLIREQRPLEITPQISLLGPALRMLAGSTVKDGHQAALETHAVKAFAQVNLIAQASMKENIGALPHAFATLKKNIDEIALGFDQALVHGELFHCPDHTDHVTAATGEKCPQCQTSLVPRRIPYSFIHARAEKNSTTLSLAATPAPQPGKSTHLKLTLKHMDGSPVLEKELMPMHTQPVQFLITGPQSSSLVHAAAVASKDTPGVWECDYTPAHPGTFRVRAGLTPYATALPEFPSAELEVPGEIPAAAEPAESTRAKLNGYHFSLNVAGTKGRQLRAGQMQMLHLDVTDAENRPVATLEPFLQAFAHITAFDIASDTVLQLHPTDGDILRDDVRGGPALAFKIYSPHAALLRLYIEVQISGQRLTVPFVVRIHP
ncbi:MAG: hypothetical protein JNG86_07515 [Verrucomicrobiaceae bacterium]|nr:hypothetical protein [Verrucomicrobiaceae bacterium]